MQFWWVNHNQTARQEVEGQYLWSPKTESNGARSEFYKNMRRASPGDLVLSYSGQAVRYVGRVTDFAFTAPKPAEFGTTGSNWSDEGWLLPVFWVQLARPVSPKAMIDVIRPLLPRRYSPLNPGNGAGNQKAYLAEIAQDLFDTITAVTTFDAVTLHRAGANSLSFEVVNDLLEDTVEQRIASDLTLDDTVRRSVIQARRGQGKFRANVEAMERCCRLTGVSNPALLIASHIKPWRLCASAQERLDGANGLLLTPDADLLFDRGFISFHDDGEVLVSPRVDREDLRRLGLDHLNWGQPGFGDVGASWNANAFASAQTRYMADHRANVFVA
ncbi:HNH endonuclease [Caulobacter sp. FWC2]|uniref:HNH endonuclease n=1 Tax=Caulobacter sp. FWC2 TaxID=69664 RepID=UPI000C153B60|nr:HNH endonuclease [Caulobacter sp. FWC2]PIB90509.1 HNH endonuclease [Caulobacter sp. FWC2]